MRPLLALFLFVFTQAGIAQRPALAPYASSLWPRPSSSAGQRGGGVPNDHCASAQPLSLTADCASPIQGTNALATMDGEVPSCDDPGSTEPDVWYSFNTGATGAVIITLAPQAGMTDWAYTLLESTCTGNEVACRIQPFGGTQEQLAPATTYLLRVFSNPDYGTAGDFSLCVQDAGLVNIPANDLCENAPMQTLAVGATITYTGDATNAQNTEGLSLPSLWHAFTLSEPADVTIDLCGSPAFFPYIWRSLYFTCPPDQAQRRFAGYENITDCAGNRPTLCYPALPAGTYYYAVAQGNAPGTYMLHVKAEPLGSHQPPNDDCSGAIPVPVAATCMPTAFAPTCASGSTVPPGCGDGLGDASDDVWYSFVATQPLMTIGVFPNSTQFGAVMELYTGSCGALASAGCANGFDGDPVQLPLNGMVPGNTYYVRVYNGFSNTPLDDAGYALCVSEGFGISIGIDEQGGGPAAFDVLPNPNEGSFRMRTGLPNALIPLAVMDAAGRTMLRKTARADAAGVLFIDECGAFPAGLYTVLLLDDRGTRTARFVID